MKFYFEYPWPVCWSLFAIFLIAIICWWFIRRKDSKVHPIIISFSVFSIVLSISTLLFLIFSNNTNEISFNYGGTIAAVLSLLLTIIIGWNIYQVVDLKEYTTKYNELSDKIEKENNYMHNKIDYNSAISNTSNALVLGAALSNDSKSIQKFQMLLQCAAGLKILSNLKAFKECNGLVSSIIDIMEKTQDIKLYTEEVESVKHLFYEVSNINQIERFADLLNLINEATDRLN